MFSDASPHTLVAAGIKILFWWTVFSPLGLLAVAVLCGSRLRRRAALTLIVLAADALVRHRRSSELAARYAAAAIVFGVVGEMLGSGALVGVLIFA